MVFTNTPFATQPRVRRALKGGNSRRPLFSNKAREQRYAYPSRRRAVSDDGGGEEEDLSATAEADMRELHAPGNHYVNDGFIVPDRFVPVLGPAQEDVDVGGAWSDFIRTPLNAIRNALTPRRPVQLDEEDADTPSVEEYDRTHRAHPAQFRQPNFNDGDGDDDGKTWHEWWDLDPNKDQPGYYYISPPLAELRRKITHEEYERLRNELLQQELAKAQTKEEEKYESKYSSAADRRTDSDSPEPVEEETPPPPPPRRRAAREWLDVLREERENEEDDVPRFSRKKKIPLTVVPHRSPLPVSRRPPRTAAPRPLPPAPAAPRYVYPEYKASYDRIRFKRKRFDGQPTRPPDRWVDINAQPMSNEERSYREALHEQAERVWGRAQSELDDHEKRELALDRDAETARILASLKK